MDMTAIVWAFLLICLCLGLKGAGEIKNLREFALGSKKISTVALVLTMYATHLGAGSTLGLIERINNIGIVCAVIAVAGVCHWYVSRFIFCTNVKQFQGCLSQAHIMEKLYGPFGLWVSNTVNIIISITVVTIQIMVIGFIIQYFTETSFALGILLGAGAVVLYAASGGVKAVIVTDLAQALLFLLILIAAFFLSVQKMTVSPDIFAHIPLTKAWILPKDWHAAVLIISLIVYALIPVGGDLPFVQRILISGSEAQLYKAFSFVALIDFIVISIIAVIAILLLPTTGEGTLTKMEIFEIVANNMHPMIIKMIVIGLLAVMMSTADSWLNSTSIIVAHDIFKRFSPNMTDSQEVRVARWATLLLGALATALALSSESILGVLLLGDNFYTPIMLIPLAAGFLGYKCTAKDFKRSVIGALAGVFLGRYLEGEFGFISLLLGLVGNALGLCWGKKWNSQLPDGNPIIKLPEYRQATPIFLGLIIVIALVHALMHLYVDQAWLVGDLTLPVCIVAATLGILFAVYVEISSWLYKLCVMVSTTFLIASMSSFAFRTGNQFSLLYLVFSIVAVLVYRQYWAALGGVAMGLVTINFWHVIVYTPTTPLSAMLIGFLILGAFCTYIYLKDTNEQLKEEKLLALTDALTGLYNRRYLDLKIESMVRHAHKRSKQLAVIMFDIDHFRKFNNTYGHEAGDAVLCQLGMLIKHNARAIDECMRYGGEEFTIAMPDTNMEQAMAMAERLRELVECAQFKIAKADKIKCTVSIGTAVLEKGDTAASLIARADAALYAAKNRGRNNVVTSSELQVQQLLNPISA